MKVNFEGDNQWLVKQGAILITLVICINVSSGFALTIIQWRHDFSISGQVALAF